MYISLSIYPRDFPVSQRVEAHLGVNLELDLLVDIMCISAMSARVPFSGDGPRCHCQTSGLATKRDKLPGSSKQHSRKPGVKWHFCDTEAFQKRITQRKRFPEIKELRTNTLLPTTPLRSTYYRTDMAVSCLCFNQQHGLLGIFSRLE